MPTEDSEPFLNPQTQILILSSLQLLVGTPARLSPLVAPRRPAATQQPLQNLWQTPLRARAGHHCSRFEGGGPRPLHRNRGDRAQEHSESTGTLCRPCGPPSTQATDHDERAIVSGSDLTLHLGSTPIVSPSAPAPLPVFERPSTRLLSRNHPCPRPIDAWHARSFALHLLRVHL